MEIAINFHEIMEQLPIYLCLQNMLHTNLQGMSLDYKLPLSLIVTAHVNKYYFPDHNRVP